MCAEHAKRKGAVKRAFFMLLCTVTLFALTKPEEILKKLQSKPLPVSGYFVHYGKGAFKWVYIDRKTKRLYKLTGVEPSSGYLIWQELPYRAMGFELFCDGQTMLLYEQVLLPDLR